MHGLATARDKILAKITLPMLRLHTNYGSHMDYPFISPVIVAKSIFHKKRLDHLNVLFYYPFRQ